ncbi:hypothetical protein JTB14_010949 [Gonioctena quinquepunctata]|nr:hypothetical protein JTB14_010949 [Gonioctena quinquepunctata]
MKLKSGTNYLKWIPCWQRNSSEGMKLQTKLAHIFGRIDCIDPRDDAQKITKAACGSSPHRNRELQSKDWSCGQSTRAYSICADSTANSCWCAIIQRQRETGNPFLVFNAISLRITSDIVVHWKSYEQDDTPT